MSFTLTQQKAMAIGPKFTGLMSIIGSFLIIRAVRKDLKNGDAGTYHRLLLGMSAYDVLGSMAFVLSTWPVPKGTPGFWGAAGNTQTCTLQGFLKHMNSAGPMYNASLGIYYVLRSRYCWNEKRLSKIEPLFHAVVVVNTLVTGLISLPLKLFNAGKLFCWIAPFPIKCKDSFNYGEEADCIRGDNALIYRLAFWFIQIWISIIITMLSMVMIYCTVLKHERSLDSVQQDGSIVRKQSRRVASEASWYMAACYVVWLPSSVRVIRSLTGGAAKGSFSLLFVMSLTNSLQGFLNFIIFFRGRLLKFRREHPQKSMLTSMKDVMMQKNTKVTELAETDRTLTDDVFDNAKKKETSFSSRSHPIA